MQDGLKSQRAEVKKKQWITIGLVCAVVAWIVILIVI